MLINNGVTVNSQNVFTPLAFRLNIWYLNDLGLVKEDGYNNNREKIWKLTDKGKEITKHLIEIFKIINGD